MSWLASASLEAMPHTSASAPSITANFRATAASADLSAESSDRVSSLDVSETADEPLRLGGNCTAHQVYAPLLIVGLMYAIFPILVMMMTATTSTMLEADAIAFWPAATPLMPQVPVTFTDGDIWSGVDRPFDKRDIPSGEDSFGEINVVGGDRHIETNATDLGRRVPTTVDESSATGGRRRGSIIILGGSTKNPYYASVDKSNAMGFLISVDERNAMGVENPDTGTCPRIVVKVRGSGAEAWLPSRLRSS